jgi:hypothetical protein
MTLINKKSRSTILSFLTIVIFLFTFYYYGCGSDSTPTNPPAATDTSVVVHPSVDIPVDRAIDLYLGASVAANDPKSDIVVMTLGQVSYYFSSGLMATKLCFVDTAGTTKDAFLSLGSVAAWGASGAVIQESNFTLSTTQSLGLLIAGITKLPTYGFFLQGRFNNQSTYSKVFGIIHVNSVTAGANPVINVSIKYNKASLNKF